MAAPISPPQNELPTFLPSNTELTEGGKTQLMATDRSTVLLGGRIEPPLTGSVKSILKPTHSPQQRTAISKHVSWATPLQQVQAKVLPGMIGSDSLEKHHAPKGMIWPDSLEKHHAPKGMIWPDSLEKHHAAASLAVITPSELRSRKKWSEVKPTTPHAIIQGLAQQTGLPVKRTTWSAVRPVSRNAIDRALGFTSHYFIPPSEAKTSDLPTSVPRKKWNNAKPLTSSALSKAMGLTSQPLRPTTERKADDLQRLRSLVKAHADTAPGKPMMQGKGLTGMASATNLGSLLEGLMQVANDVASHSHRGSAVQQDLIEKQLLGALAPLTHNQKIQLLPKLEGRLGDGLRAIGGFAQHQLDLSDTDEQTRDLSRLAQSTRLVGGLTRALRSELHIKSARFNATNVEVDGLSQLLPNEKAAMVQWLANQKHVAS